VSLNNRPRQTLGFKDTIRIPSGSVA
jgi:hypothetical protein